VLFGSDPRMARVYLLTEFDTNIFIGDLDMPQKLNPRNSLPVYVFPT